MHKVSLGMSKSGAGLGTDHHGGSDHSLNASCTWWVYEHGEEVWDGEVWGWGGGVGIKGGGWLCRGSGKAER